MEKISNNDMIFNSEYDSSEDEKNENNKTPKKDKKSDMNSSDSDITDENTKGNKLEEEEKLDDEKINIIKIEEEKISENQINNNITNENKTNENQTNENKIIQNNSQRTNSFVIEQELIDSINKRENVTKENLMLAEKINFKNKMDKLVETDEFGFIKKKEDEKETEEQMTLSKKNLLTINARTEKWRYMLEHFDVYKNRKKKTLKNRTRKGIPDSLRSQIWQLFGEIDKYIKKDEFENLEKLELDQETEITIIKDLDRTFPSCSLFTDKYGGGQRKLFKVLSNYSKFNKDIGYVQGMGYIVALFLIYMDEKSSFYLLHSLIKNYELEGIYLPGFPELKKKFYVLLNLEKKYIPKIYEVFKRDGIYPSLYASEWFICLFSKDLKPNVLVRIFDTFLYEGYKVIYRFALAFLKMKEKEFVNGKPGIIYTMDIMKTIFNNIDVEYLFKVAFNFHLSRKHIAKFEQEYEKNKNDENNEFIKQV